jgi:hypothetical protein
VRSTLATWLFVSAAACASFAVCGWWLGHSVLSAGTAGDHADVVLEDPAIRNQISVVIAEATAAALGQTPTDVRAFADEILQIKAGAMVLDDVVEASYSRMLDERRQPVRINASQMVQVVRDDRASGVDSVILPVEPVGRLGTVKSILTWAVRVMAAIAVVCFVLAVFTRPERRDAFIGLASLFALTAMWAIVLGYVVPVHLLGNFDDGIWMQSLPRLAKAGFPLVLTTIIVCIVVALGLVATAGSRRKRQWSTPMSFGRSNQQHRWS